MLPLGYQDYMIRVVDIVKSAMGLLKVGLFHDQGTKDAVTHVGA